MKRQSPPDKTRMIIDNNSWPKVKTSIARYFCNALVLKLFISLLVFATACLFFVKLDGYLSIEVLIDMSSSSDITPGLYFMYENDNVSNEKSVSAAAPLKCSEGFKTVKFIVPKDIKKVKALSLLTGEGEGVTAIKRIRIKTLFKEFRWSPEEIFRLFTPNANIAGRKIVGGALYVHSINYPPYLTNRSAADVFDPLARSIDIGYLSKVCSAILALLCLAGLMFVRFRRVELYCRASIVVSLVFVVFIGLPLLSTFLMITYNVNISEQRTLAQKPPLSDIAKFPAEYTRYFDDNFGFRDMLIRWNNRFKATVLRTSPIPGEVVFGRDGWLYLSSLNALEDYRGSAPFRKEELIVIKRTLLARQKWLLDRGIKNYYLLVPPNKETIYPEYLPGYMNKAGAETRMDQLVDFLGNTAFKIIDLRDTLIKAKHTGRLYLKTDTHWNSLGAFWAYRKIISTIGRDYPQLVPMDISGFNVQDSVRGGGDLYVLLSVSDLFTDTRVNFMPVIPYKSVDGVPGNYVHTYRTPTNPLIVREVNDGRLPKIVVFRDSFFTPPLNFFAEHFRRSVYVWTMTFDTDIIEKEMPDIVVTEIVERNLYTLKDANRP